MNEKILLGPGPSMIYPKVLKSMSEPTIGHLDPDFLAIMNATQKALKWLFKTENEVTFPVSGPGSAAMEMSVINMVEPGDTVVVCVNGVFGGRLCSVAERCGATVIRLDFEWGTAIDPLTLEETLKLHPEVSVVVMVHAETSTGVESDVKNLCAIAKEHECFTIVDAVTSLGGIDFQMDEWQIDVAYSGAQKCLSGPAGISMISFSPAAVEHVLNRKTPVQSWLLDLELLAAYWIDRGSSRTYHHTAPIQNIYGLSEALKVLQAEGLEASFKRHHDNGKALADGLTALGFELPIEASIRLPQLTVVNIPEGINDAEFRADLLKQNIEIGGGLGLFAGKAWRIGLMGCSSNLDYVKSLLEKMCPPAGGTALA